MRTKALTAAAGFILVALSTGCRTTRSTTDHTEEKTADSTKYYKQALEQERDYSYHLEQRIREDELAGVTFNKPDTGSNHDNPCPDRPPNTIDIGADGHIHASGDIASVSFSKKKIDELQKQIQQMQRSKQSNEQETRYITKTIEHWHTETKKVQPSWFWKLLYIAIGVAGTIACYKGYQYVKTFKFITPNYKS